MRRETGGKPTSLLGFRILLHFGLHMFLWPFPSSHDVSVFVMQNDVPCPQAKWPLNFCTPKFFSKFKSPPAFPRHRTGSSSSCLMAFSPEDFPDSQVRINFSLYTLTLLYLPSCVLSHLTVKVSSVVRHQVSSHQLCEAGRDSEGGVRSIPFASSQQVR